jgi:predicted Rossmann-fold nucleotide-binding protein
MHEKPSEEAANSFLLAFEDQAYLQKDELRPFRLALEFNKADLALKEKGIVSTIVVFGSSRTLSPDDADAALVRARSPAERKAAEQQQRQSAWYEEARRFGRIASERGGALTPEGSIRRNVIVTGGGPGIMEAANRGASEAGALSIGFNIVLPAEQTPNPYTTPELTFRFHYFAMRKMHFAMRASALVVFPGGFGTMVNFEALADLGMIDPSEFGLFDIVDTAEEAWSVLAKRGLTAHTPLREP